MFLASTQSLSGTAVEFHECCLATGATAGALTLLCSFLEVLHGSWEIGISKKDSCGFKCGMQILEKGSKWLSVTIERKNNCSSPVSLCDSVLVSANFGNLNPFTLLKLLNCCVLPDEVTLVGELLRSANGELTLQPLSQEQAKRNILDGHRVYKCGGRYMYIYIYIWVWNMPD